MNYQKLLGRTLIPGILIISTSVFIFMFLNLSRSVNEVAETLLQDKIKESRAGLNFFFHPVREQIQIAHHRGVQGQFDAFTISDFNQQFRAITQVSKSVSSLMLANDLGDEYMLLADSNYIINRVTTKGSIAHPAERLRWKVTNHQLILDSTWAESTTYDPRMRPWYTLANEGNPGHIYWTSPYQFFTTNDPGITVSTAWVDSLGVKHILAFDVLLTDVSKFTTSFNVSEHGMLALATEDNRILGLPKHQKFNNGKNLKTAVLRPQEDLDVAAISIGLKHYQNLPIHSKESFQFNVDSETWWGKIEPYQLGNQLFYIEVFAPESDFLNQIRKTQTIIIIVFILFITMTLVIARALNQRNKFNHLLNKQNRLVESKNKEIMDSIQYAKRIQAAILPPPKIVMSYLTESFILYLPKDIVAGDFYWMEKVDNTILFAAADCTGHGVPGALMSVLCNNALNRAVREYKLTDPGQILDKTREIVIEEFEKSEEDVKDGMDIALCALEGNQLRFAGANNPLWVIQEGVLTEIKGNRQPIGKFEHAIPYTTHHISLNKGNSFYIFSDGYCDQFGGEHGKKMKSLPFKNLLLTLQNQSMDVQRSTLERFFEEWKGSEEQVDDVCVIGVRYPLLSHTETV